MAFVHMVRMTEKAAPFLDCHRIEDLEEQLIDATYALRNIEEQIQSTSATDELQPALASCKSRIKSIEREIRAIRHGY